MLTIFNKIFTWWNQDTFGTRINTLLFGKFVGKDSFGNGIPYANWVKSVFIDEDKQSPEINLNIVDASGSTEASRWFNGGELSEFSGLKEGQYQINLQASELLASLSYRIDDETDETFFQLENNA